MSLLNRQASMVPILSLATPLTQFYPSIYFNRWSYPYGQPPEMTPWQKGLDRLF